MVDQKEEPHDACVLKIAEKLKKDHWEVDTELENWSKPSNMDPVMPDLKAEKKGCLTKICQIVTPEMFEGNMEKYLEVKNYCAEYDFSFYIMEDGKPVEVDLQEFAKQQAAKKQK